MLRHLLGLHVEENEEDREELASEDEFFDINEFTFNIALTGEIGSGKSTFVNTIRG